MGGCLDEERETRRVVVGGCLDEERETRRVVVGGCLDEERERQGEWLWEGVWMKRERDKESGCGRVFG